MTKFLTQPAAKDKDQAQVPGQPKAAQQQPTPQQEPQATQQQQQQQPGGAAQAPPGSRGESLPTPTGAPAGGDIAAAAQAARARGGATDPLQSILNSLGMGGTPLAGLARQLMAPSPDYARPPAGGMGGGESQPVGGGGARNAYARAYGGDVPGMSDNGVPAPGQTGEVTAPTEDHIRQSRAAGTDTPPTAGFSPYLAQERSPFAEELNRNPRTKWETLAVLAMEHDSDPAAVAESLLNRSKYAGTSVSNMLHSGFYGPVNSGRLGREVAALQRDPQRAAKLNAGLETALRGSNLLGGATDQGSHRDPNVGWKGGRVVRMGEVYNDWAGGPGGHAGAALFRKMQQQRVRQMGEQADLGKRLFAMDITQGKRPDLYGAEIQGSIGSARARGGESIGRSRAQGDVMMDEERRKREKGRRIEAEAL